eukprot:PITA_09443
MDMKVVDYIESPYASDKQHGVRHSFDLADTLRSLKEEIRSCKVLLRTDDLSWNEFKRIFRKKYLSERYYDDKAKEFYELNMGSMTEKEYVTKFMELLGYASYLIDEKAKVQRFFNGLPLTFRDRIEYDEPRSLKEVNGKLKHLYDQSKRKNESQQGWKEKDIIG